VSGRKDREERREQRLREETEAEAQVRRQRLLKLGSAVAFLAIVAVAVAVIVSQSQGGGGGGQLEDIGLVRKLLAGIPQSEMVLGEPNAKVKLVEFGDLQCSACKAYSEGIIPEVIDSKVRSGRAKIEFRNFRIIGEESVPAGAAALAAGRQGHGWTFLELFYRNQGGENAGYVTDSFMTDVAKGADVPDIGRWNADRNNKAIVGQVSRTTAEAQRFGFSGTPSFAIEGPGTSGLEPLGSASTGSASGLEAAIDQAG
jgi:protein-disulfide isomerase